MSVLLCVPGNATAQSCAVPAQYASVGAAIADPACKVVAVAAGIYAETVKVKRTLTLEGEGPDATVLAGPLLVSGPETKLTLASIGVDTAGPLAGCYLLVFAVTEGAEVYPEAVKISNATGTPSVPCPIFADGFELP